MPKQILNRYLFFSYLVLLGLCLEFVKSISTPHIGVSLFVVAVFLTYGVIYLLPTMLFSKGLQVFLIKTQRITERENIASILVYASGILLAFLTTLMLNIDRVTYSFFGFHLNPFVLNKLTTSGGIDALGGGTETTVSYTVIILSFLLLYIILLQGVRFSVRRIGNRVGPLPLRIAVIRGILFIMLSIGERLTYAVSYATRYEPIQEAAEAFPLYLPTRRWRVGKITEVEKN